MIIIIIIIIIIILNMCNSFILWHLCVLKKSFTR